MLIEFLHEQPKAERSKYFDFTHSSGNERAEPSAAAGVVDESLSLFRQPPRENTLFAKRLLLISSNETEVHHCTPQIGRALNAYRIRLKPELVKTVGSPVNAMRLVCELAQRYQPLLALYEHFAGIDHDFRPAFAFQHLIDAMGTPALVTSSATLQRLMTLLRPNYSDENFLKTVQDCAPEQFESLVHAFTREAGRLIHNPRINENERVEFLKILLSLAPDYGYDLTGWLKEVTADIDFTTLAWSYLKNFEFVLQHPALREHRDFAAPKSANNETVASSAATEAYSSPQPVVSPAEEAQNVQLGVQQELTTAMIQLQSEKFKQDIAATMASDLPIAEKLKKVEEIQTQFNAFLATNRS